MTRPRPGTHSKDVPGSPGGLTDPQCIDDFGRGWVDADRERSISLLWTFAEAEFPEATSAAARALYGPRWESIETEMDEQDRAYAESCFRAFCNLDYPVEGKASAADLLLLEESDSLDAGERCFLERFGRARLSLYEVIEVEADRGIWVQDLLPGAGAAVGGEHVYWLASIKVPYGPCRDPADPGRADAEDEDGVEDDERDYEDPQEYDLDGPVPPFSLLATRLVRRPDMGWTQEGERYLFPPGRRHALLHLMRAVLAGWGGAWPWAAPEVDDRRRLLGPLFFQAWLADREECVRAEAARPEGLEHGSDSRSWLVMDPDRVNEALLAEPRFVEWIPQDPPPAGLRMLHWFEPGSGPAAARRCGVLTLCQGILTLSAVDKCRLSVGQELVERACGWHLRRLADPGTTPHVLRAFLDGGYRHWADAPNDALDGLTPRQALRAGSLAQQVVDLLKWLEFLAFACEAVQTQRALHGRFRWLWRELGLQRPGTGLAT